MVSTVSIALLLACTISLVKGKPFCKIDEENQRGLVCVAGNGEYNLQRGFMYDNNNITSVILRDCRITDIENHSFIGFPNLRHLDLSLNGIKFMNLGALEGSIHVIYLNLSHNMITNLPQGLFDQKPNVEVLDLSSNRLVALEMGIFDSMPKLRHVDLSGNPLIGKNLNPYIFDSCIQISFMDFSRIDMNGTPDNMLHAFSAIHYLNLDRCLLTEVPKFATRINLKTLKHITLSTNQIIKIDDPMTFVNLENIEIINLTDNIIESINPNVFKSLKKLNKVVLRNNRLTILPDGLFSYLPKLISIDLASNLIENAPINTFRGTPLKNLNLSRNRLIYLEENFCLKLNNSGAQIQKFFFDGNPLRCDSLRSILKEVKKFNLEYNGAAYNGVNPLCVTEENPAEKENLLI